MQTGDYPVNTGGEMNSNEYITRMTPELNGKILRMAKRFYRDYTGYLNSAGIYEYKDLQQEAGKKLSGPKVRADVSDNALCGIIERYWLDIKKSGMTEKRKANNPVMRITEPVELISDFNGKLCSYYIPAEKN